MRILELFAGIGAFSKALENIGVNLKIVDAVDNDKFAIKSFNAIHKTNFEPQDIKNWDKDFKDIDIITHGSPCQDFSVAGKQAGGDIGSGTRSSLMYETIRIVGRIRPQYVLWENVKNILSKKHKHNFDSYIEAMSILGYNNYYQVLNAKDYGVPQNRERVFTVSVRKDIDNEKFIFPEKEELKLRLRDILEKEVEEKYYLSEKMIKGFIKHNEQHKQKGTGFIWKPKNDTEIANTLRANASLCPTDNTIKVIGHLDIKGNDNIKRVYSQEGLSPTLTDMQGGNRQPKILIKNATKKGYIEDFEGDSINKERIRKLTPKECWRLMGFSDEDFEKVKNIPMSDSQLYKQAGNTIIVNVLEKIFTNLITEE